MKYTNPTQTAGALVLAIAGSVYAGDYSPTAPLRPSAGLVNDWLRKDNPYMAAWDIGTQVRLRYEVRDNFAIAGNKGSVDFLHNGVNVDNAYFLDRTKPHIGYTAEWFSAFVEGRSSGSTADRRNPNPESDGVFELHQAYVT